MLKINYPENDDFEKAYLKQIENKTGTKTLLLIKDKLDDFLYNYCLKNLFKGLIIPSYLDEKDNLRYVKYILIAPFKDLLELSFRINRRKLIEFYKDIWNIKNINYSQLNQKIHPIENRLLKVSQSEKFISFISFQNDIKDILKKELGKNKTPKDEDLFKCSLTMTNELSRIFNYDKKSQTGYPAKRQTKIADFFRKNHEKINLSTCYFCNINYINIFNFKEYLNPENFLNTASHKELKWVVSKNDPENKNVILIRKKLPLEKAESRKKWTWKQLVAEIKNDVKPDIISKLKQYEENLKILDGFTLDHLLDKGKYPLSALSLYNLVPSCYTCNTKLKGSVQFIETKEEHYLSPTSQDFRLHEDISFYILLKNDIETLTDITEQHFYIEFKNDKKLDSYIDTFWLQGRYNYKYIKKDILEMIEKTVQYSTSQQKELKDILAFKHQEHKFNINKKDLFGREIFEGKLEDKSLTKLKRDIAKNIGIL